MKVVSMHGVRCMDSVFHVGLDLVLLSPYLLTHPPET
jgi:hypothetical protein